jgi:lysyl-tRNA synthetase class 2
MELASLKDKAALSGKKWDKAIKSLNSNNLTKTLKTNEVIEVELL